MVTRVQVAAIGERYKRGQLRALAPRPPRTILPHDMDENDDNDDGGGGGGGNGIEGDGDDGLMDMGMKTPSGIGFGNGFNAGYNNGPPGANGPNGRFFTAKEKAVRYAALTPGPRPMLREDFRLGSPELDRRAYSNSGGRGGKGGQGGQGGQEGEWREGKGEEMRRDKGIEGGVTRTSSLVDEEARGTGRWASSTERIDSTNGFPMAPLEDLEDGRCEDDRS